MARKIRTTKSPEERRAEAEGLHATIAEQVEELRSSEAWTRFLTFAQAFHRYSINNLLLILAQKPEATHVAGYRTWQKLGRQVRKGERGIRIFGGRDVRETVEDEQTGEEKEQRRVRFFPVSVFDMAQTDPIDPEADDPSTLAHRLRGDDPLGILAAVTDYLTGQGWTVEREAIAGWSNGSPAGATASPRRSRPPRRTCCEPRTPWPTRSPSPPRRATRPSRIVLLPSPK